ncbi:MAG TPA: hypothetical protein VFU23_09710 [Gemmatimonadales bacterium]|nr:hypothetical protein [Gemmatimonadales bacterium]
MSDRYSRKEFLGLSALLAGAFGLKRPSGTAVTRPAALPPLPQRGAGNPGTIKDIKVMQTVCGGRMVFGEGR